MKNVHSLNQDDVLSGGPKGGDDELSPSEFGDEIPDDDTPKKGRSNLVMYSGIGVAVLVVVFFVWKVFISPHMQGGQQESEAFQPLAAAQPQQVAPAPSATQLLDPAAGLTPAAAPNQQPGAIQSGAAVSPAAALAPQQAPVPSATDAVQPPGPAGTTMAPAVQAQAQVQAGATPAAQMGAQGQRMSADGLAQANARIDNLERSLAAIQEMVNKMSVAATANAAAKPGVTPTNRASSAASTTPKASRLSAKSSVEKVATPKKSAASSETAVASAKAEFKEEKVASRQEGGQRATLKAVLDGRAWFQTKSGETLTVSVGEEVPGLGVVKSIDTDRGEVRFANGVSVQ